MIKNLSEELRARLAEVNKVLRSDLPKVIGHEAREHFTDNFRRGGFVDGGLKRWPDVKRRDPSSPWYGFEYRGERRTSYAFRRDRVTGKTYKAKKQKRLNYSPAATKHAPLTSKRNRLMNSIHARTRGMSAVVYTAVPYARVHNEGGEAKVFGKRSFTMPKRQFMGHSAQLDKKVKAEIERRIDAIFR